MRLTRKGHTVGESPLVLPPFAGSGASSFGDPNEVVLVDSAGSGLVASDWEIASGVFKAKSTQTQIGETGGTDIELGPDAASDVYLVGTRDGRVLIGRTTKRILDLILKHSSSQGVRWYNDTPTLLAEIRHDGTDLKLVTSVGHVDLTPVSGSHVKLNALSHTKAGSASTERAYIGGSVNAPQTTNVGNVGAGEDNLMIESYDASVLGTNGDSLICEAAFIFALNANNKRVRAYYEKSDGTESAKFYDTGAIGLNAGGLYLRARIHRVTSTSQYAFCGGYDTRVPALAPAYGAAFPAVTLGNATRIRFTGEATADDDIIQYYAQSAWEPPGA